MDFWWAGIVLLVDMSTGYAGIIMYTIHPVVSLGFMQVFMPVFQ